MLLFTISCPREAGWLARRKSAGDPMNSASACDHTGIFVKKAAIAARAAQELAQLHPSPPAFRLFDAGMGDATVLSRVMRSMHRHFPTVPLLVVAKEISLEDVRLGLEKMADRFFEHPHTVLVITNLNYSEAPRLMPRDVQSAAALNWQQVRLTGRSAHEYEEQIEALGPLLSHG